MGEVTRNRNHFYPNMYNMNNTSTLDVFGNCKYSKRTSDLEMKAKFIAPILVCIFGIFGNIFIIVLTVKCTVRKNLHHLIINLAVSDALYLFVHAWFLFSFKYNIESFYPEGVWGDTICKITIFLTCIPCFLPPVALLVISIERFRATTPILQRRRPYTLKQRIAVVSVCWLIPTIMSSIGQYTYHFDERQKWCGPIDNEFMSIYLTAIIVLMMFDMITILMFNIMTIRRLSKGREIQTHLNGEQQRRRARRSRSAVSMVLASTLLSVCCWFPSYCFDFVFYLPQAFSLEIQIVDMKTCIDWDALIFLLTFFSILNSFSSPFIYIIFLSDFREAAKRVLCSGRASSQQASRKEIPL